MSLAPQESESRSNRRLFILLIVFVVVVIVGALGVNALIKTTDERNLNNAVKDYTGLQNNTAYHVVVLNQLQPPIYERRHTVILYEESMGGKSGLLQIGVIDKAGTDLRRIEIPADAIQLATYLPKTSATFSFVNNIIRGGPEVMTAQVFVYRNLNTLQLNLTPQQANEITSNG